MASGQGRYVYFSEADRTALDSLEARGIPIICQLLPTDKQRIWETMKANAQSL